MKSVSSQVHVYELRKARLAAYHLASMISRDVWWKSIGGIDYLPPELSVRESLRREWVAEEKRQAETVFTFRFEGGTVVRITMHGAEDYNYGFQWWVARATVRYYEGPTDSQYPELAGEKRVLELDEEFFRGKWWEKPLPVES